MIEENITDALQDSGFELMSDAETKAIVNEWGLPCEYVEACLCAKRQHDKITDVVTVSIFGTVELVIINGQTVIYSSPDNMAQLEAEFMASLTFDDHKQKVQKYARRLAESMLNSDKKDDKYYNMRVENSRLSAEGYDARSIFADTQRSKKYITALLEKIAAKDKKWLINSLTSNNKISRKIFELETGVKLGTSNKSMEAAIDAWK